MAKSEKKRKSRKSRAGQEKCATKWCRNRRAAKVTRYVSASGKTKVYHNFLRHCWKCRSRMLRESQPATYVLNAIRNRARQRGLPFTITLPEFRKFCAETNYLELRGRKPDSLSIDRKNHDQGYHIWNIRVSPFNLNCTNGHTVSGRVCAQNERVPEECDYAVPTDPDTEPF
jgi:hypothetical protein